jgi:hypothetical protein
MDKRNFLNTLSWTPISKSTSHITAQIIRDPQAS